LNLQTALNNNKTKLNKSCPKWKTQDFGKHMSYQWLRQLTRRDIKTFASNQEDRYVNIDPSLRSHRPNPVRMLPAPCTLLFGNGPQVRLMFRLCFDKDQGSKIRNVTMAKAWFMNCNKFALTVVLHPSWGFQLRSLIIHEVSLRRFHVYIIPTNQQ